MKKNAMMNLSNMLNKTNAEDYMRHCILEGRFRDPRYDEPSISHEDDYRNFLDAIIDMAPDRPLVPLYHINQKAFFYPIPPSIKCVLIQNESRSAQAHLIDLFARDCPEAPGILVYEIHRQRRFFYESQQETRKRSRDYYYWTFPVLRTLQLHSQLHESEDPDERHRSYPELPHPEFEPIDDPLFGLIRQSEFEEDYETADEPVYVNLLECEQDWENIEIEIRDQTTFQEILNLARVRKPKINFDHEEALCDSIFAIFETAAIEDRTLVHRISVQTGISERTLRDWRRKFKLNNQWRPGIRVQKTNHRIFSDLQEHEITQCVLTRFIQNEKQLTMRGLQTLIKDYYANLPLKPQEQENVDDPEAIAPFRCSRCFLDGFLKRNGLSYRKNRTARRPPISEQEVEFMFSRVRSFGSDNDERMVNIDESFWLVLQPPKRTIALRGAESVHTRIDGDPKAGFTFMAAITKNGKKLPLYILAKGTTYRCHRQFGTPNEHPGFTINTDYVIDHSESGWMEGPVFLRYLGWLKYQMPTGETAVLLDQYPTHVSASTKSHVATYISDMELIPVPAGGTGTYQPLDRRIFGNLKAKGAAKWERQYIDCITMDLRATKVIALQLLLESWREITVDHARSAWSHFDSPVE